MENECPNKTQLDVRSNGKVNRMLLLFDYDLSVLSIYLELKITNQTLRMNI
jgi:hypothetical protein